MALRLQIGRRSSEVRRGITTRRRIHIISAPFHHINRTLTGENAELREALFDVLRFWLERGVDGFRLDAINFISKAPGYPDGMAGPNGLAPIRPFVCNGPKVHTWLSEMKKKVLSPMHAMTVGEADGSSVRRRDTILERDRHDFQFRPCCSRHRSEFHIQQKNTIAKTQIHTERVAKQIARQSMECSVLGES